MSRYPLSALSCLLAVAGLLLAAGCSGGGTPAPPTPVASVVVLEDGLAPVDTGFVDANGARLYYEIYGEGEPLLLIMGLGANHLAWADHVALYAQEFQVIVFDNRGTGQSDFPDGVDCTIPLMADDAAALLDALGVEAAHVYGISLGGMIAQEFALRHSERVRSLVLGATTPGGPQAVAPQTEILRLLTDWVAADGRAVTPAFLNVLYSPGYLAEHGSELLDGFWRYADYPRTSGGAYAAQMRAARRHDTYDRLPDITAPTLVIHGTDDPLMPTANGGILAERIPGAELVLLEGARHFYLAEKRAEADAAVLDFLRAHSEQGAAE